MTDTKPLYPPKGAEGHIRHRCTTIKDLAAYLLEHATEGETPKGFKTPCLDTHKSAPNSNGNYQVLDGGAAVSDMAFGALGRIQGFRVGHEFASLVIPTT